MDPSALRAPPLVKGRSFQGFPPQVHPCNKEASWGSWRHAHPLHPLGCPLDILTLEGLRRRGNDGAKIRTFFDSEKNNLLLSLLPPPSTLLIPHSSFLIPHSSFLIPHSSFLIPHSSFLIPPSSLLPPPFSLLIPPSSFLPPHSSLLTPLVCIKLRKRGEEEDASYVLIISLL